MADIDATIALTVDCIGCCPNVEALLDSRSLRFLNSHIYSISAGIVTGMGNNDSRKPGEGESESYGDSTTRWDGLTSNSYVALLPQLYCV